MLRKFAIAAALAAGLALPGAAVAGPHGWHGGHGGHGWHGGGWHGGWHGGYGHRRGWRGYGYGGGSCWRWNPYFGTWRWVCY